MSKSILRIQCPTCGIEHVWSVENAYRPFCSERCQQIDLGAWASDAYQIEGQDVPADTSEFN